MSARARACVSDPNLLLYTGFKLVVSMLDRRRRGGALLAGLALARLAEASLECPDIRIVQQRANPDLINQTMQPDNKHGLEDGIVVRSKAGDLVMIAAEMFEDPMWVKMRIGVWRSHDGYSWTRRRTLRESSGNTDGTDPHAASWGPFLVHDPTTDRWIFTYVGYRSGGHNYSGWLGNFEGTIYYAEASEPGDGGLDSDFGNSGDWRSTDKVLLGPDQFGTWFPCQGLQGTDSMYPYQLEDGRFAAMVGTSHQEAGWQPSNPGEGKWPVSLAMAPSLAGPWERYNPDDPSHPEAAPCLTSSNGNIENPIISRIAEGFIAIHDFIGREGEGFGATCSSDGRSWGASTVVPVPGGVRTPFGILPMTMAESEAHAHEVDAYGVTTVAEIRAKNHTLAWLFYTQTSGGWERFRSAIVEVSTMLPPPPPPPPPMPNSEQVAWENHHAM